jgi:hypothetical protein
MLPLFLEKFLVNLFKIIGSPFAINITAFWGMAPSDLVENECCLGTYWCIDRTKTKCDFFIVCGLCKLGNISEECLFICSIWLLKEFTL